MIRNQVWPQGYKNVHASAKHEILNAHKYQNMQKCGFLQAQISLLCYVFLLMNVTMPIIIGIFNIRLPIILGILIFISNKNFMLS